MGEQFKNQYEPDMVSAPGETLREMLEEKGMSQAVLAQRTGRPKKTINEIIQGKAILTFDTAIQLERVLGVPANFWNKREASYRAFIAKSNEDHRLLDDDNIAWLKAFPVREMIDRQWISDVGKNKVSRIKELLNFFAVASPKQWKEGWGEKQLAFRKSERKQVQLGPTSAWLRKGEILADKIECAPFNKAKLHASLDELRALTSDSPDEFLPKIVKICQMAGVAVVFLKELTGVPVSGATLWINPNKAMVLLSFRHKTDDHFWFTFFHELGHIFLHSHQELFLESPMNSDNAQNFSNQSKEDEANLFSAEYLISSEKFENWLKSLKNISKESVFSFSKKMKISPGIVVGRLQHSGKLPYTHLNSLKKKYALDLGDDDYTKRSKLLDQLVEESQKLNLGY